AEVDAKLVVKETKSAAGRRLVALPQSLVGDLAYHLEHYAEPGPEGRVFVGEKGASPRRGHWTHHWRRAKEQAGVPATFHFHDLRHTGNHLAATTGASTRELMGRMGHSSMRAALIYQHRTVARDRHIADQLDALISAETKERWSP
ncbi:MAG TPA: tyrosine-type recombinase/integrase, partial [Dermatophilaceae bacterium]|nr:tyrosine-type recombinase/integrase [Dermatophilaceae bacterium]